MRKNIISGAIVVGIALGSAVNGIDAHAQNTTTSMNKNIEKNNKEEKNKKDGRKFVPITDDMRTRAIDIDPSLADDVSHIEEGTPQSPLIPEEILNANNNVDLTSQEVNPEENNEEFDQAINSLRQALVDRQQRIEQERADAQARRAAEIEAQSNNDIGTGEVLPTDNSGNVLPPVVDSINNLVKLSNMDRKYDSDAVQKLIDAAKTQIGVPYVWGGTSPGVGLDCSGFTQWAYKQVGVNLPRTTYDQINVGTPIYNQSEVKAGDLIFPHTGHVGIAISSTEMIHAPQTGEVVKIGSIYSFHRAVRIL